MNLALLAAGIITAKVPPSLRRLFAAKINSVNANCYVCLAMSFISSPDCFEFSKNGGLEMIRLK